ncbi:hypothetical protein ACFQPF_01665 [Fictibacillus iocasae]|uniref:Uncharacterized protein n=1 Tax=Fictibacillus iocasae TaxID=2715437 RepID=A0ABW2NM50_9BACL
MEFIIFGMLAAGLVLLLISFKKDRGANVETQLENFSIQLMKEIYQIKKKLKVLEEEIMINDKH